MLKLYRKVGEEDEMKKICNANVEMKKKHILIGNKII